MSDDPWIDYRDALGRAIVYLRDAKGWTWREILAVLTPRMSELRAIYHARKDAGEKP